MLQLIGVGLIVTSLFTRTFLMWIGLGLGLPALFVAYRQRISERGVRRVLLGLPLTALFLSPTAGAAFLIGMNIAWPWAALAIMAVCLLNLLLVRRWAHSVLARLGPKEGSD